MLTGVKKCKFGKFELNRFAINEISIWAMKHDPPGFHFGNVVGDRIIDEHAGEVGEPKLIGAAPTAD